MQCPHEHISRKNTALSKNGFCGRKNIKWSTISLFWYLQDLHYKSIKCLLRSLLSVAISSSCCITMLSEKLRKFSRELQCMPARGTNFNVWFPNTPRIEACILWSLQTWPLRNNFDGSVWFRFNMFFCFVCLEPRSNAVVKTKTLLSIAISYSEHKCLELQYFI